MSNPEIRDECACGCGLTRPRRYNPKTGEPVGFILGHHKRGPAPLGMTSGKVGCVRRELASKCGWTESLSTGEPKPVDADHERVGQLFRDVVRAIKWSPTLRQAIHNHLTKPDYETPEQRARGR